MATSVDLYKDNDNGDSVLDRHLRLKGCGQKSWNFMHCPRLNDDIFISYGFAGPEIGSGLKLTEHSADCLKNSPLKYDKHIDKSTQILEQFTFVLSFFFHSSVLLSTVPITLCVEMCRFAGLSNSLAKLYMSRPPGLMMLRMAGGWD